MTEVDAACDAIAALDDGAGILAMDASWAMCVSPFESPFVTRNVWSYELESTTEEQ